MSVRFFLVHPTNFEKWCWENSIGEPGIAGSETSTVEMSWRLAKAGHEVVVYAPLPDNCLSGSVWRNTTWYRLEEIDFSQPGVWVIYRKPSMFDEFPEHHPNQQLWLLSQDFSYVWTAQQLEKLDRFMALSQVHADWVITQHPELATKMMVTANGVKVDLIEEIERENPNIERNFKKIVYASSPDRGLEYLLRIFKRAHEREPDLTLHIFYGFDNIDKLKDDQWRKYKAYILGLADQPGVFIRGRVPQRQLYTELLGAGMMCYPSTFWETGFISGQESQACGAIPVITPLWAQGEVVKHGVFIEGDPYHDKLVQARFSYELVRLAQRPDIQEEIRAEMMPEARARCDWNTQIPIWTKEAERGLQ
jgi:glycosyltransferase involved in cell wall biosynthesis